VWSREREEALKVWSEEREGALGFGFQNESKFSKKNYFPRESKFSKKKSISSESKFSKKMNNEIQFPSERKFSK